MGNFTVVSLGRFISQDSFPLILDTYQRFLKDLTPKYKRKTEFYVLDKYEFLEGSMLLIEKFNLQNHIQLVSTSEQDRVIEIYKNSSLLFLPVKKEIGHIIAEAYSFSLPIITYDNFGNEEYVDQTCGMLHSYESDAKAIEAFKDKLKLLIFDPDALAFLNKGAKNKHNKELSWGRATG